MDLQINYSPCRVSSHTRQKHAVLTVVPNKLKSTKSVKRTCSASTASACNELSLWEQPFEVKRIFVRSRLGA